MHEATTRPARVLVPWDGTPEANASIPCALALAAEDAHLVLLHVAPIVASRLPLSPPVVARRAELHERRLHAALTALHGLATDLAMLHPALTFEIIGTTGDPAREITRVAAEERVELIVVTLHHERAMRSAAHRSVTVQLAREAAIPTLIVRPGAPGVADNLPFRRVLCPYIADRPSTGTLRAATHIAQGQSLPVRIAAIADPAEVLPTSMTTGITPRFNTVDAALTAHHDRANAALDQAIRTMRGAGIVATAGVVCGPVVESIGLATAPGDLIVVSPQDLGTRDGDQALARLLRESPAPVLVLPTCPTPTLDRLHTGATPYAVHA